MSQVIVVGGGLAGLSAAHTVIENGGRVLLLDKVWARAAWGGGRRRAGKPTQWARACAPRAREGAENAARGGAFPAPARQG